MNYIDSYQSKEEKKEKYDMLKNAGLNYYMRKRARDWTLSHVKQLIEAQKC